MQKSTVTKPGSTGADVAGEQQEYTVMTLNHDIETWKFETDPTQDLQVSRLNQGQDIKKDVLRRLKTRDFITM